MGELRHGLRVLLRHPATSVAALLSLVIGIALCSSVFSVLDWLWLNASPFGQPREVVRVFTEDRDGHLQGFSWQSFQALQEEVTSLEGLTAVEHRGTMLTGADGESLLLLADVTARNFFELMQLVPAAGGFYSADDDPRAVAASGVVISHSLWQRAFGGDPAIVGGPITLSRRSHTLLGVAPRGFAGIQRMTSIDVWFPPESWGNPSEWTSEYPSFSVLGRVAPDRDLRRVQAEIRTLVSRLDLRDMATRTPLTGVAMTDSEFHTRNWGRTGGLLLALVGAVLIIACANVAGLLMARTLVRDREMAVRVAVGGSRGRLMRQLLLEGLVLALVAAGLGLACSALVLHTLPALLPPQPAFTEWGFALNGRVAGFAILLALLTVFLFGMLPAVRASRPDLTAMLKGDGPSFGQRGGPLSGLRGVVVLQLALALVLTTSAGLLLQSYLNTQHADLGFERREVLVAWIVPLMGGQEARIFYEDLTARVEALPGVRRATMARHLPFYPSGGGASLRVSLPEGDDVPLSPGSHVKFNLVGPQYFDLMGIPLLSGRAFAEGDRDGTPRVAVVNQTFAARAWPERNPLGRTFQTAQTGSDIVEVVGVVPDGKYNDIDEPPEPYIYLPFDQMPWGEVLLLAETAGPAESHAAAVRSEILDLSRDLFLLPMTTTGELFRDATYQHQIMALALGVFTVLGLLLAVSGLYGVSVYAVNRRVPELGVRMALGADGGRIVGIVLREGGRMIFWGLVVGVPLAVVAALALRGSLYGVAPLDPGILAGAAVALAGITLAAAFLPARQALRIDPVRVMRQE
jgi:putative ABC transport system permease protein